MKSLICITGCLLSISAWADSLSKQDLQERFELRADIYSTNAEGTKILNGPERTSFWRMNADSGELKGNWSSGFEEGEGTIGIYYDFKVSENGTISGVVSEYKTKPDAKRNEDPKNEDILQKKEFNFGGLEPLVLKVQGITKKHYIVRLMPSLREISKPISVDNLPLAGTGISVFDSDGFIWAENLELNGKYTGLTSHRGTLALSYQSFPGSKEMGVAEGNVIQLNADKKLKITLKSASAFLPSGVTAKVYAVYLPGKKTPSFHSLHSFDTSKLERILEKLK